MVQVDLSFVYIQNTAAEYTVYAFGNKLSTHLLDYLENRWTYLKRAENKNRVLLL